MARDTVLKRLTQPGTLICLAFLVLAPLLLAATQPASVEAKAAAGYWQQTSMDTDVKKSDDTHTYSVSDGSSTQTLVAPDVGDRFTSTATWSSPKASYLAGETVTMSLHMNIDEYVWNGDKDSGYIHQGLNSVGDGVLARIDVTGLDYGGVTAEAINLTDADGKYIFSVKGENGTEVVHVDNGTVSAAFPAGSQSGDLKTIRVVSQSGVARYNYTWVAEGDDPPAVASSTTHSTTTSATTWKPSGGPPTTLSPEAFDDVARFNDLAGEVEIVQPIQFDANGEPSVGNAEHSDSAELDTIIRAGAIIRTKRNSTAIVTVGNFPPYVIGPETEIMIPSQREKPVSALKVFFGEVYINVKHMIKYGEMPIDTSNQAVGIKGTTLVVEDDGETSTVKVIEGTVECTAKADGETKPVSTGEMLAATAHGLGEIEIFDAEAEQAEWDEFMAEMELELDQGGFPLWALILIIVVAAALLAGVAAFLILRSRKGRTYGQHSPAAGHWPAQTVQSAQPMATDWYYLGPGAQGGQQVGPLTWAQLFSLAQAGTLTANSLVWNPALPQWLPAGQIGGLFSTAGGNP